MKKTPKKLKLNKVIVAKLHAPVMIDPKNVTTLTDLTCELTIRTCASLEFSC